MYFLVVLFLAYANAAHKKRAEQSDVHAVIWWQGDSMYNCAEYQDTFLPNGAYMTNNLVPSMKFSLLFCIAYLSVDLSGPQMVYAVLLLNHQMSKDLSN